MDQYNVYNCYNIFTQHRKGMTKGASFYLSLYLQQTWGKLGLNDSFLLSDKCTVHIYWCEENGFFVDNYTLLHNVYCT